MKNMKIKYIILAVVSVWLMAGCTGGPSAGGGTDGSGIISRGVISNFGSIIINGTEYDTRDAVLIVNGEEKGVGDAVIMDHLDIGRVVTVVCAAEGDGLSAVADQITYNDSVSGPVEVVQVLDPIQSNTKQVTLMGQLVNVNAVTIFKNTSFEDIAPGDMVEVSGFFDDTAVIWATFFNKLGPFSSGTQVEVTGYVSNLNVVQKTFKMNNLTVDYMLSDTSNLPDGNISEGLYVEVSGTLDAIGDSVDAEEIRPGDQLEVQDANHIEVTGFVSALVTSSEFTIGNQLVEVGPATIFVDGSSTAITLGVKLEAEGTLEAGVLVAEEIEFWGPDQIDVEGVVTAITPPNGFTIETETGDLQVVETNGETVFEGIESATIALGDSLEIKGVPIDIARTILIADKVSLETD